MAHRGGGAEVAENTIAGIEHGIKAGVDAVEVDVRATKDGELVLLHDGDLLRVCGQELLLREVTLRDLLGLRVFHEEPFATFDEALECVGRRAKLFVEIKEPETTGKIISKIVAHDMMGQCVVISFFEEALQIAKECEPAIQTGLIYNTAPGKIEKAKALQADLVLPYYPLATTKANAFAHDLGLRVGVWSVNSKKKIEKMVANGVDLIASDYPTMLVALQRRLGGD